MSGNIYQLTYRLNCRECKESEWYLYVRGPNDNEVVAFACAECGNKFDFTIGERLAEEGDEHCIP